jgi:hypothetical protein
LHRVIGWAGLIAFVADSTDSRETLRNDETSMPRTTVDDDDSDEDEFGDDTIPCPHCKRDIYDSAEQCPYCGHYISDEDPASSPKPAWIIVGGLLCLAIVILWVWKG